MSAELLPAVELQTGEGVPSHSVIWLHGLGADGHDFPPIVPHLGMPDDVPVRFVFPHAPSIPVTLNMGMVMPAWYDIRDTDLRNRHDEDGIRLSATRVEALLAREHERGVPASNIVLAGFSQGGAIALHVGLRYTETLAGILALSTYLVCSDLVEAELSQANRATPILMAHGSLDPMVVMQRGSDSRDRLVALGYTVEWHEYPMEHQVCLEEIEQVGRFLRDRLTS